MLTPLGIILIISILLKAFGLIDVSWWIALIPLWMAILIAVIKEAFKIE